MSLRKNKKTNRYIIDLHLKIGGRLRLSAYTNRRASLKLQENISALDACLVSGERPDRELTAWLEILPDSMKKKLVSYDLVAKSSLERSKTVNNHLQDYIKYQQGQSAKGVLGKDRLKKFNKRIGKIITDCNFKHLSDIDCSIIDNWITQKYSSKELAAKTLNHYLQEFKQFCKWLVDNDRLSTNPVSLLKPITIDSGNITFSRRALTQGEIDRLINTTRTTRTRNNLTGEQRCLIYLLALFTGLRYSEIRSLQRESFDFDNNTVTIKDIHAKNNKTDTLPLKPELADQLQAYFISTPALPKAAAFSNMQAKGIYMLKKDLTEAGIEYITDEVRADFHSLRHTYGTLLAKSGVLPQLAQKLMRHSNIDLTTNLYTHLLLTDKQDAIKNLPVIKISEDRRIATGTDNTTATLAMGSDQILPKSVYSGNNHMDNLGQFDKIKSNDLFNVSSYTHSENTVNTGINTTLFANDLHDTNWRRDGDSNPG